MSQYVSAGTLKQCEQEIKAISAGSSTVTPALFFQWAQLQKLEAVHDTLIEIQRLLEAQNNS